MGASLIPAGSVRPASSRRSSIEPWELLAWLLPAAAVLLSLMPTGDLAYQIRAGQIMWDTGHVLRMDPFTYTMAGRPWVDQQWGAQLVFASLYRALGWRGLVAVRAGLVSLLVGATFRRTRSAGSDPLVAGLLSLGSFLVAVLLPGTVSLRPQLLAAPLFVLSAWVLGSRLIHPRRLLVLPAVGVMWANLHGSFLLLTALVAICFVSDLVARRPTVRLTGTLALISLVTPLATPWGWGTYRYVADLASSPVVRRVIDEWRPLWTQEPAGGALLFTVALIVFAVVRYRTRLPTVEEVLGLALFTALAVASARNLLWWALFVPPVIGGLFAGRRPGSSITFRDTVVVGAVLCAILAGGAVRVAVVKPQESLLSESPLGITAALGRVAPHDGRVFDGWWGSWFELALPDVPMFVDARAEVFPQAIWDQYFLASHAAPGWQQVLDRWAVGVVVLSPDHQAPLIAAMTRDPRWVRVYRDGDGVVFVRAGP